MSWKVKDEIRNKYKTKPFKYSLQTYFTSDTISPCQKSQKYEHWNTISLWTKLTLWSLVNCANWWMRGYVVGMN